MNQYCNGHRFLYNGKTNTCIHHFTEECPGFTVMERLTHPSQRALDGLLLLALLLSGTSVALWLLGL